LRVRRRWRVREEDEGGREQQLEWGGATMKKGAGAGLPFRHGGEKMKEKKEEGRR
jgi:hypothetical protein